MIFLEYRDVCRIASKDAVFFVVNRMIGVAFLACNWRRFGRFLPLFAVYVYARIWCLNAISIRNSLEIVLIIEFKSARYSSHIEAAHGKEIETTRWKKCKVFAAHKVLCSFFFSVCVNPFRECFRFSLQIICYNGMWNISADRVGRLDSRVLWIFSLYYEKYLTHFLPANSTIKMQKERDGIQKEFKQNFGTEWVRQVVFCMQIFDFTRQQMLHSIALTVRHKETQQIAERENKQLCESHVKPMNFI